MRLIDADALSARFEAMQEGANMRDHVYLMGVLSMVDNTPTIDAVPVVNSRWVKAHGMMPPEYHHRKQCSMCGGWALQDYFGRECMSHYCPNCGAKMDGGAT